MESAPAFCLKNQDEAEICLRDLKGAWIILYFYPKDSTPGCTQEACDFTESLPRFETLQAIVLGVSPDSPRSHQNFIAKSDLKITLLSDPTKETAKAFGAWGEKKLYGKVSEGIIRSTFIIDPQGRIAHAWRGVKVAGHAKEVLETLEKLQKS
ncbi:thioredoxin-dependent thiol peroxidase [Wolinella succinogenes]|uniref:thioredoxin-dependent thiol peroxidase n=1 Tax=Wolinella succinogenes TaxID=844 RepID=UPI002409648E|nr:thioredoxin-dependent thiol peroxidase [Wolinella succinogenes]